MKVGGERSPTKRPVRRRLLALAVGSVVAVVVGDLLFRAVGPVVAYSKQGFIKTPQGLEVPLAEIYNFSLRRGDTTEEGSGPRGRLQPGLNIRIGYERPVWSYFDDEGGIPVQISSLGFRDEEFPVQKPDGEFRVLALGDSFTYGMGVRQEDSWPEVLEDRLRAARGRPVQVINCGMACGASSRSAAEYAPWLEREGLAFGPDLVVLGFCLNDFSDDVPMLGYRPPPYEPVLGGVCRMLDYWVNWRRGRTAAQQPTTIDIDGIVARDHARWEEVQEGMRHIRDVLEDKGIPFVCVVMPMLSQLDGPYPYAHLHETVDAFCRDEHIRVLDMLPAFRGRDDYDLWAHPTDQHPNDVGHRLIADGLADYLLGEDWFVQRLR